MLWCRKCNVGIPNIITGQRSHVKLMENFVSLILTPTLVAGLPARQKLQDGKQARPGRGMT